MDYLLLVDRKPELLVGKMLHSVVGLGKYQFEEPHFSGLQVHIVVVVLLSMKIGLQLRGIAWTSEFPKTL